MDPSSPYSHHWLAKGGVRDIVDVCSGGGGPWPEMRSALVNAGAPDGLRVKLTDLYPNAEAFAKNAVRDALVTGAATPLDIEHQTVPYPGMRTFFSSFHHFAPPVAERVLRNAMQSRQPVLVAEVTQRSVIAVMFMLLAPLFVWLATPRLRRLRGRAFSSRISFRQSICSVLRWNCFVFPHLLTR